MRVTGRGLVHVETECMFVNHISLMSTVSPYDIIVYSIPDILYDSMLYDILTFMSLYGLNV